MPKYGGRELARQGFKGTSTGLPDDPAMRQWMPEVLFDPQIPGPVNQANCKPIEPTQCYDAEDMDVFKPLGNYDGVRDSKSNLPKPKTFRRYHDYDWDGANYSSNGRRTPGGSK